MTDINATMAMALWREGLCIIPTAGGGEKRPFAAWKEYQRRMPTQDEVERCSPSAPRSAPPPQGGAWCTPIWRTGRASGRTA